MEYPVILNKRNNHNFQNIFWNEKTNDNNNINKSIIEKSYDFLSDQDTSDHIIIKKKLPLKNLNNSNFHSHCLSERINPSLSQTQKKSKVKKKINEIPKTTDNIKKIILFQKKIREFLLKKKQKQRKFTLQKNCSQVILYKKKLPKISSNKICNTKINWTIKPKICDKIKNYSKNFHFTKIYIKNTKSDIKKIKKIQKFWKESKRSNIFTYIYQKNSDFFDYDSYQRVTSINNSKKIKLKPKKLNFNEIDNFYSENNNKTVSNSIIKIPQFIQFNSKNKNYNSIILQYENENRFEKSFTKYDNYDDDKYNLSNEIKLPTNFVNISLKQKNPKNKDFANIKSNSISIDKRKENIEVYNNNLNIFHKNELNYSYTYDRDNMNKFKNLIPNKFFIKINSDKIEKKLVINTNDIFNKPNIIKLKNKNKKPVKKINSYFAKEDNNVFYWAPKMSKKQILINKYYINDTQNSEKNLELERSNTSQKPKKKIKKYK